MVLRSVGVIKMAQREDINRIQETLYFMVFIYA